jgi:hypothetical protein
VDRVHLDGAPGRLSAGLAGCGPDCRFTSAALHRYAASARAYPEIIDAGACGLFADLSAFAPVDPATGEILPVRFQLGDRTVRPSGDAPEYAVVRAPDRTLVCAQTTLMAEDRLAASAARMADDYGAVFGHLPVGAPRLIVTTAPGPAPGRGGLRGVAAGDDLVFLFVEPGANPAAERALAVLSHEIAHLWIGRRARLHPQFEQAWIYEGAAEYLSLKQSLRIDLLDDAAALDTLARHASACLAALDTARLLLNGSTQTGGFAYHCGTLVAFYADQAMQLAGSRFEAAMADLVAGRRFRAGEASALDVLGVLSAHMDANAEAALRHVFLADIPEKRTRVLAALAAAGLGVERRGGEPAPAAYLARVAADHVLANLCPAGAGAVRVEDGLILELSPDCDGPAGTSELVSINGADPRRAPYAALDVLDTACGSDGAARIGLGEEVYEIACAAPLPAYFDGFALDRARALSVLSGTAQ